MRRVYKTAHRVLRLAVGLAVLAALAVTLLWIARHRPGDLPGTALDLGQPVGMFTGRKLAGLTENRDRCLALLDRAGIAYQALAPKGEGQCRAPDQVRLDPRPPLGVALAPRDVAPSCPVAAALAMWNWNVVQPAALKHFGSRVSTIGHFGSYACRRMVGNATSNWSEHATADAIDIASFVFADGHRVSIVGDWTGDDDAAAFLHDVRDGACDLFATVLSPDYNAAHRDHLHLDQAARGALGRRACK